MTAPNSYRFSIFIPPASIGMIGSSILYVLALFYVCTSRPALLMRGPAVFWRAAGTRLEQVPKMALGLKAHGLGDFSYGERRICQEAGGRLEPVFQEIVIRRVLHGQLKAPQTFRFAHHGALGQVIQCDGFCVMLF